MKNIPLFYIKKSEWEIVHLYFVRNDNSVINLTKLTVVVW